MLYYYYYVIKPHDNSTLTPHPLLWSKVGGLARHRCLVCGKSDNSFPAWAQKAMLSLPAGCPVGICSLWSGAALHLCLPNCDLCLCPPDFTGPFDAFQQSLLKAAGWNEKVSNHFTWKEGGKIQVGVPAETFPPRQWPHSLCKHCDQCQLVMSHSTFQKKFDCFF